MRRRLVSLVWDGGVERPGAFVRVTVLERRWFFLWRETSYIGRFVDRLFDPGWEFWCAETGRDLDRANSSLVGHMVLGAGVLERAVA